MRKLLLILAVLAMACSVSAQIKVYGIAQAGSFASEGQKPAVGYWLGGEYSPDFASDTSKGFAVVNRTGFFYADTPDDIQGASSFLLAKKTLGLWNNADFYAAIGGGGLYEVTDGDDYTDAAMKIEIGINVFGNFGFGVGCDVVPVRGGKDEYFIYGILDLTPRLQ